MRKDILNFYKKTSCYTDLGLYKKFARKLPNDIKKLCKLQRQQTIHPFDLSNYKWRKDNTNFYGDMSLIPTTDLAYENDLFPTAISMFAELLRRDNKYHINRKITDKIHICCREHAILLVSTLKAKQIPARCRSGFANYITDLESAGDHWITEYYDSSLKRWVLVDSDMYFDNTIPNNSHIDFNIVDIPREHFIFGAQAYLGLRNNTLKDNEIYYTSNPLTYGLKAALKGLFFDFHCLMNNEIIFLHTPKYIVEKDFELTEEEYLELDELAKLMLNPDENFDKLLKIWDKKEKFRIMSGGLNN